MTTTTTAQPTLSPDSFPAFAGQLPNEGWRPYGLRAFVYLLTHGEAASVRLDLDALNAAGDVATGPDLVYRTTPAQVLARYTALQRYARTAARVRRAELWTRLQALEAASAPEAAEGGPAGDVAPAGQPDAQNGQAGSGQGGGGAKVPRRPKPNAPSGGGTAAPAWQLPALDLADAF